MNNLKFNKDKKSCKDVFNAFMLENADYVGNIEMPVIRPTDIVPQRLVCFSKIRKETDYNAVVHFYEHDYIIERIWKNPNKYLPQLQKFAGVILPDFSLYRDEPLIMQMNNIFRSRQVGAWLQDNGLPTIVNMRYGDERTYKLACLGVPHNSIIAIGTHGTMKNPLDRKILEDGLPYVFNCVSPHTLVVYGTASKRIVSTCDQFGVKLLVFKSEYGKSHSNKEVR